MVDAGKGKGMRDFGVESVSRGPFGSVGLGSGEIGRDGNDGMTLL